MGKSVADNIKIGIKRYKLAGRVNTLDYCAIIPKCEMRIKAMRNLTNCFTLNVTIHVNISIDYT